MSELNVANPEAGINKYGQSQLLLPESHDPAVQTTVKTPSFNFQLVANINLINQMPALPYI